MTTQEVWDTYHLDLKRFIMSKTHDKMVTDDILQNVFINIHNKLYSLRDNSKLKPWIFTITRNTIYDYFKSKGKTILLENFDVPTEIENHIHTEKDCLRGIINKLPEKYRIPIYLGDIKGIKQQEIAEQLNIPLPTVKSQIQRARKLIVKGFMNCCGFTLSDEGKLIGEIQDKEDCTVCNS
jgi:RNA polymerase sigma-70 factor (ECF subfamily)